MYEISSLYITHYFRKEIATQLTTDIQLSVSFPITLSLFLNTWNSQTAELSHPTSDMLLITHYTKYTSQTHYTLYARHQILVYVGTHCVSNGVIAILLQITQLRWIELHMHTQYTATQKRYARLLQISARPHFGSVPVQCSAV
jgi:hypothetical protein